MHCPSLLQNDWPKIETARSQLIFCRSQHETLQYVYVICPSFHSLICAMLLIDHISAQNPAETVGDTLT
jgi:hypothetical protein